MEDDQNPLNNIFPNANVKPPLPIPAESSAAGDANPEKTPSTAPQVTESTKPPVSVAETEMRPYWIIKNDGGEAEGKLTLEAACTAAADGQIVEIRYNGLLPDSLSKPIRIKNKSLTIRAGKTTARCYCSPAWKPKRTGF